MYTIEETKSFLKTWGRAFDELDHRQHPQSDAYYQACVDAHEGIQGKPLRFYNLAGLKRTLLIIADDFEREYKSKRQGIDYYKERAELMRHIETLLVTPAKVMQTSIF
jgi:hypothetical protein